MLLIIVKSYAQYEMFSTLDITVDIPAEYVEQDGDFFSYS